MHNLVSIGKLHSPRFGMVSKNCLAETPMSRLGCARLTYVGYGAKRASVHRAVSHDSPCVPPELRIGLAKFNLTGSRRAELRFSGF
jgi:hypothetical protein